jgi:glycosyltransferase involved in cell wall biosynthesis
MSAEPALSIVTPVFNGETYIEHCIENVLAQGVANVEHIIVDGGSTDGTLRLVEAYAARHPHLRLIPGPDKGQSDALNKGIRAARAKVIGILNCDDFYEPGVFGRVIELFQGRPEPSLLVANCVVHNEVEGNRWVNRPNDLRIERLLLGTDYVQFPGNPSAYFYHKSLHDSAGFYDVDENFAMDLEFILSAVQTSHVYYFDEHWGNFRYHCNAKTFQVKMSGAQQDRLKRVYGKHYRRMSPRQKALISFLKLEYGLKHMYWDFWRSLEPPRDAARRSEQQEH